MTLLEDLKNIDLSGIVDARASITISVNSPELKAVIEGGAAQTALAGLGTSVQALRTSFTDPVSLIQPLTAALGNLSGPFDPVYAPVGRYLEVVSEGATIMAGLVRGLDRDPAALGQLLGLSLDGMFDKVGAVVGSYSTVGLGDLDAFRGLVESVELGVPTRPDAFADLAIRVLLPVPGGSLRELRGGVDAVLSGALSVSLPTTRTSGLLSAFQAITVAATAGDVAGLQAALRELDRVRAHTIEVLQGDLRAVLGQLGQIRFDALLAPLIAVEQALRGAQDGVLEFLADLRVQIAGARAQVEALEAGPAISLLARMLDFLEVEAHAQIVVPIEAQVHRLEAWLRGLLGRLPLRELRAELSGFILGAAAAIRNADLDRYARLVRDALARVRTSLNPATLQAEVQEALQAAEQAITSALSGVLDALAGIGAAITGVADTASGVLNRMVAGLTAFNDAVASVTLAVNGIGVSASGQQVVDTLVRLRETAEKLLTVAPLPEPMRPTIEQLIQALDGVDFNVLLKPVEDAAAQLKMPTEIEGTVTEGLHAAQDAIANLIPSELIASIEAEVKQALDVIRDFNPASLLPGIGGFLDEAASFVESLDPRPHVATVRGPYLALLDAIDAVAPARLLAPAITAYDNLLGSIPIPAPDEAVHRLTESIGSAGEALAQRVTAPLQRLSPPGALTPAPPPGESGGGGTAAPEPPPTPGDLRPGDIIRLFGYLPAKLREALAGLQAGPAGEILRTLDGLVAGLARDLRRVQAAVWEIEARLTSGLDALLIPLGPAQVQAQFAIRANVRPGSIDVDAALLAVAQAGPGALRLALAETANASQQAVREAAGALGGAVGATLDRAATALERFRLSGLTGGLDALLAALDPEPLAAELDAFVGAVLRRAPALLTEIEADLQRAFERLKGLIARFNPGAQAQKFLVVLDVLREELDLLSPRRLAAELGEVHAAIRATVAAYDPELLAAEVAATLSTIAADLKALDPATLLGDVSFLDDILDRVEAAVPTKALKDIGGSLNAVGDQLAKIDIGAMIETVNGFGPNLVAEFKLVLEAIRREIVALLESLRFATGSVSVSVSVSGSVGGGGG